MWDLSSWLCSNQHENVGVTNAMKPQYWIFLGNHYHLSPSFRIHRLATTNGNKATRHGGLAIGGHSPSVRTTSIAKGEGPLHSTTAISRIFCVDFTQSKFWQPLIVPNFGNFFWIVRNAIFWGISCYNPPLGPLGSKSVEFQNYNSPSADQTHKNWEPLHPSETNPRLLLTVAVPSNQPSSNVTFKFQQQKRGAS